MKNVQKALIVAGALILTGTLFSAIAFGLGIKSLPSVNIPFLNIPLFSIGNTTHGTGGFSDFNNGYNANGKYAIPTDDIDSISVKWIAGDVKVSVYEGDEIKFTESSKVNIEKEDALKYGVIDDKLHIQYCEPKMEYTIKVDGTNTKNLEVLIPKKLAGALDNFEIEGASCDITATDITAEEADIASVSGTILLENLNAKVAQLSSISGTIDANGNYAKLSANTTSGRIISTNSLIASDFIANTISGSVKVYGEFINSDVSTISGNVEIENNTIFDNTKINTASGRVSLKVLKDIGLTVKLDSISSKLNSNLGFEKYEGKYVLGDGNSEINVSTISGGLNIEN